MFWYCVFFFASSSFILTINQYFFSTTTTNVYKFLIFFLLQLQKLIFISFIVLIAHSNITQNCLNFVTYYILETWLFINFCHTFILSKFRFIFMFDIYTVYLFLNPIIFGETCRLVMSTRHIGKMDFPLIHLSIRFFYLRLQKITNFGLFRLCLIFKNFRNANYY